MKNYLSIWGMMLIGIIAFFSSCSDDEDIFYYSFKNIEYSVNAGDGMTQYDTQWKDNYVLINNGDSEVKAGPGDLYSGFHEEYNFSCENPADFNPTVGHVHVPLPNGLASNNLIVFDEKEGEYSLDKVEVTRSYQSQMYTIPAKTKLTLQSKVEMKKLVLSYTATFQRHPSGRDHIVTGKFVRYIPVGIALVEKYEPVN